MNNTEKLSRYIDSLNNEAMPKEHADRNTDEELEELMDTVRKIKSLREPVMPGEDYEERLVNSVKKQVNTRNKALREHKNSEKTHLKKGILAAAAAAVLIFALTIPQLIARQKTYNVAKAMEQAYHKIIAYHGILETAEINGLGEIIVQSRQEVWADAGGNYFIKRLDDDLEGYITVNNGTRRWQVRPDEKKVYLFASEPDPYRFTFDLGTEVRDVSKARSVTKIGQEMLLDRETDIYEITPDGGLPYKIWVDKATDLPVKKETAMYNALQMKVYYTDIEFTDAIPAELLSYDIPEGFEEVEINPEQSVATLQEAKEMAGFMPDLPGKVDGYFLSQIAVLTKSGAVKLTYSNIDQDMKITFVQEKAKERFKAASEAVIGLVNDNISEIFYNYQGIPGLKSIRWQESGMQYTVYGSGDMEILGKFAQAVSGGEVYIPSMEAPEETAEKPRIDVPYDIETEKNDQRSVDAGHSPWKLDPVFVAQVFVNLLVSPEGIEGEYEIPYESIEIIKNDGVNAVVKVDHEKSPAEYVYLKRLVRQDDTGIWTVVGYDPAEN